MYSTYKKYFNKALSRKSRVHNPTYRAKKRYNKNSGHILSPPPPPPLPTTVSRKGELATREKRPKGLREKGGKAEPEGIFSGTNHCRWLWQLFPPTFGFVGGEEREEKSVKMSVADETTTQLCKKVLLFF